MSSKNKKPIYIDLFCGAGGFSAGFDQAGFKNVLAVDYDKTFCKTYRKNFPSHTLLEKDIASLTKKEIQKIIGDTEVDIVVGGPPCQGFSIAGSIGRKFIDDPRNHLFKEFIRFVDIVKPKIFVMENVARLYTHNNGNTREDVISRFKKIGYRIEVEVLNSADVGVPQARRRVVFIGTRINTDIIFPKKQTSAYVTVREAIGDLPALHSGETSDVPNHVAMNHTDQMLKKMKYVTDGGSRLDIPAALRPKSGDVRKYIRYTSSKPAITITGDMRKVFHYAQNRALSVRELARLQSFDDSFVFEGPLISQQQQVGNAVPPLLAKAIASGVAQMLHNEKTSNT